MRAFCFVASALLIGILAGYATAGDCYRTSAVQVQQVPVATYQVPVQQTVTYTVPVQVQQQVQVQAAPVCTYATCAPQALAAPAYQSYTTAAAFAAPTYYSQQFAAPVYRSQTQFVQRSFATGAVYGGGFVQQGFAPQRGFARAGFGGGGAFGGAFQPGGGGLLGLGERITGLGDGSGQFLQGALIARFLPGGGGFRFKR